MLALTSAVSRFPHIYQATFTDDFYYYLSIASSMANGSGSAFFGSETNGYHPLWALVLTVVVRLLGSGPALFAAVSLIIAGLSVACFVLFAAAGTNFGLRSSTTRTSALLAGALAFPLTHLGLETGLILLGLSGLLWWISVLFAGPAGVQHYLLGGVITSACILARLDSVIVLGGVFLAVGFYLANTGRLRYEALLGVLAFGVGLLPTVAYLCTNVLIFGSMLPASAGAKSLVPGTFPSLRVIRELSSQQSAFPLVLVTVGGVILLTALLPIRSLRMRWPSPVMLVLAGLLIGTLAYYLILGWQSSWPVHAWYAYPLVPSVFLLSALLLTCVHRVYLLESLTVAASVIFTLIFIAATLIFAGSTAMRADSVGRGIEAWAATHPGSFAMGDMAGNTAWRLQRPFVQLEGLVMPPGFTEHLREGEPLHDVLQRYDVTYYATISTHPDGAGCYRLREPALAPLALAGMAGHYCGQPLLTGDANGVKYYVFAVNTAGWQDTR